MLADLVLPRRCVGCGRPGEPWCTGCLPPGPAVAVVSGLVPVRSAGAYRGPLREAILRYKERGRRDLAGPLARLLAAAVRALGLPRGRVLLVPVPSARRAAAARGGDHMARLGARAAACAGVRCGRGGLRLVRVVADSAGLDIAARARNLDGAFEAGRAPPDAVRWSVVIVDDVITTGATVREAHRALTARGWQVAGAAVLAATPRVHPARRGEPSPLAPPSESV